MGGDSMRGGPQRQPNFLPISFTRAERTIGVQFKGSGPVRITVQRSDELAHVAALWFLNAAGKRVPARTPA
jgi:hypothetical protein